MGKPEGSLVALLVQEAAEQQQQQQKQRQKRPGSPQRLPGAFELFRVRPLGDSKKAATPADRLAWQAGRRAGPGQGSDSSCPSCDATRRRYKAGNLDSASGCDRRGVAQLDFFSASDGVGTHRAWTPPGPKKTYRDPSLTVSWYLRQAWAIINFACRVGGRDWSLVRFKWRRRRAATPPPPLAPQLRLRQ